MFGQAKRLLPAVGSGICAYTGCSAQRGTGPRCERQEEAAVPPPRPRGSISSVDLKPGLSSEWASQMSVVALTPSCLLDGLWAPVVSVVLTSASGSISYCSRIDRYLAGFTSVPFSAPSLDGAGWCWSACSSVQAAPVIVPHPGPHTAAQRGD